MTILSVRSYLDWSKTPSAKLEHPMKDDKPTSIHGKRYVFFVCSENQHFSLGIIVNPNWGTDKPPQWILLHLDSRAQMTNHCSRAHAFAAWLMETDQESIKVIRVPTPQERSGSNDCGLYTAHYLKIFLDDDEVALMFTLHVGRFTFPKVLSSK
jgi:Ulp1 family protease